MLKKFKNKKKIIKKKKFHRSSQTKFGKEFLMISMYDQEIHECIRFLMPKCPIHAFSKFGQHCSQSNNDLLLRF